MLEYPKIQSLFKRDLKTFKFIEGEFKSPEFEYLAKNEWIFTEKVDGTNIRIHWDCVNQTVFIGGRTDAAQLSTRLYSKLNSIFTKDIFLKNYPTVSMTLYGEGYGARIGKSGGLYLPNDNDFILFDVLINNFWLARENIEDIANKLNIKVVQVFDTGTVYQAVELVKTGLLSSLGNLVAEGLVLKPCTELFSKKQDRIITKIKYTDFADI